MVPKSAALLPLPKEFTPGEIRLRPMESTTVPVTTGGKKRRRGFRKKPSTVSNRPPMQARHQHGVLQKAYLHTCKFFSSQSASAGNDQQRRKIACKHGQHMCCRPRGIA